MDLNRPATRIGIRFAKSNCQAQELESKKFFVNLISELSDIYLCLLYHNPTLDGIQLYLGNPSKNKPKMAYSRDLPKMARQQCGIMD